MLDLGLLLQEFSDRLSVLHMPGHPDMQGLQTQVQIKGALGRLYRAQIPHQLGNALCDESAALAELLSVYNTVIGFIRCAEAGILVRVSHPVEIAAVYDGAADSRSMAVHVFGGGMGHDIRAPFDGPAVDRGREGIVHDQRHAVGMGNFGKLLNIQDCQGRIGNGLAEHGPCIVFKSSMQLFFRGVGRDEGRLDPHFGHGDRDQIEGPAVDRGGRNDMAACFTDIEKRKEIGRLTG